MNSLPIHLSPIYLPNMFWFERESLSKNSQKKLTLKDFLDHEKNYPEQRFELADGQLTAMAGASGNHATISMNLSNQIYNYLDDNNAPCQVYQSDIKVKINEYTYRYPDVLVDCGGVIDTVATHVVFTAEVLSKSTAYVDLRQKMDEYKLVETMQEILLIDQYKTWVQLYQKIDDDWQTFTFTNMTDMVKLNSLNLSISLEKIYKRVVF